MRWDDVGCSFLNQLLPAYLMHQPAARDLGSPSAMQHDVPHGVHAGLLLDFRPKRQLVVLYLCKGATAALQVVFNAFTSLLWCGLPDENTFVYISLQKINGSGNNLEFEHRNVVLAFHVEVFFRDRTEEPPDHLPEPKRCATKDLACLWVRLILSR